MEGYSISAATIKKAKSYKMSSVEYLIYSDLRAAGWPMRDAWAVAFQGQGLTWSKAELEREMNKLESLGSVQTRIAELQGTKEANSTPMLTPEQLAKATSKEEILKDLVIVKSQYKPGSKEWTEAVKMIADYNKIKQDELETTDNTIHFFLPVRYPTPGSKKVKVKR